jgi:hypothetical protein
MIGGRYHVMVLSAVMVSFSCKGFKFNALREFMTRFSIMVFLAFAEEIPC